MISKTVVLSLLSAALASYLFIQAQKSQPKGVLTDIQIMSSFSAWKARFVKTYNTPSEQSYRLKIFAQNLKKIESHNRLNTGYTLGLNKFSDMSFEVNKYKRSAE